MQRTRPARRPLRRTSLAGLAVVALAATSACGGASPSGSGDASRTSGASGAGGSASGASGSAVDTASLRKLFTDATASAGTVHVAIKMTGSIPMTGSGDMNLNAKPLQARLELSSAMLGGTGSTSVEMLMVDDAMYLQAAALGDKYVKIPLADKDSPLAALGLDSLDPAALVDRFGDTISGATYLGKESLEGTTTEHYRFTVDTSAVASALPSLPPEAASVIPADAKVDVWFDGDGRYQQMTTDAGAQTVSETFSDWGKAFTVTAPPASQLTDLTSLAGSLAGGS